MTRGGSMASDKKPSLRWQRREAAPAYGRALRMLRREFRPEAAAAAETTAAGTPPEPLSVELPNLSAFPAPLDKAVRLLQVAAGIEHGLMIHYLYAGYGFSQEQREIVSVAMEEMAHLMTVQNLLRLVGAEPHLDRQDFGPPGSDDERLFDFD